MPTLLDDLRRLPLPLALAIQHYLDEPHPVLQLHRLCDAVEVVTRFCVIAGIAEVRAHADAEQLTEDLAQRLRHNTIERPTFGQWAGMLRTLLKPLAVSGLVLPELPRCIDTLLRLLPGGERPTTPCLLALRNDLVHGGGVTAAAAATLLRDWQPRLEPLWHALTFLLDADVCHYHDGRAVRLLGAEVPLSADLALALKSRPLQDHVLLLRHGRWLDLWPLVAQRPDDARSLLYYRADAARLRYLALGAERPFSDQAGAALATFRRLFRLDQPRPTDQVDDFDQEMQNEAAALVGRRREREQLLALVRATAAGLFWISGPGGIGKSYLLAGVRQGLLDDAGWQDHCVIAWRFRASDQRRCDRFAFFRHAVARLGIWLQRSDLKPNNDPSKLYPQLIELVNRAGKLEGRRVVFLLDGLDEIARQDAEFLRVPATLVRSNVLWLCAGRAEEAVRQALAPPDWVDVFPSGLERMSDDDIRGMLVDETGELKYRLLVHDRDKDGAPKPDNDVVRVVVERADGLPLFVHHVVQDILSGHFTWEQLQRDLPQGLIAYYNDLLRRRGIGPVPKLVTPVVVLLAWAVAPLDEETLLWLLVRSRLVYRADDAGRQLVGRVLAAVQSMVRPATAGGRVGYEPNHSTFRDHIQADPAGEIGQENDLACEALQTLVQEWPTLAQEHPAREYVLRYGVPTLLRIGQVEEAVALLKDWHFLEAKTEAGLVFDLVGDFVSVEAALPEGERRTLELIEEAIRRDIHFIDRHREDYPQGLFQCLWNSCWWYDTPEAAKHYDLTKRRGSSPLPWERAGGRLSDWMERWREEKQQSGCVWLRSLRPPSVHLGTAQKMVLRGHTDRVSSVGFSADGRRIVSGSWDKTVRVWDTGSGAELLRLSGHAGNVSSVSFAADGRRVVSGSADQTVRVWDAESGAELLCLNGHTNWVNSVSLSADGRRIVSGSWDKTVRVWDTGNGAELLRLSGHAGNVSSVSFAADGRRVVSGSEYGTVRVWEAASGGRTPLSFRTHTLCEECELRGGRAARRQRVG